MRQLATTDRLVRNPGKKFWRTLSCCDWDRLVLMKEDWLLAKNLSTLSTSAPAPSCSVGPSVFRQGTCDRGIWRKPVAFAADAEGYINIKVWGFNGRFAISSPSGLANCKFC